MVWTLITCHEEGITSVWWWLAGRPAGGLNGPLTKLLVIASRKIMKWVTLWCCSLSHRLFCAKFSHPQEKLINFIPLAKTFLLMIRTNPQDGILIESKLSEKKKLLSLKLAHMYNPRLYSIKCLCDCLWNTPIWFVLLRTESLDLDLSLSGAKPWSVFHSLRDFFTVSRSYLDKAAVGSNCFSHSSCKFSFRSSPSNSSITVTVRFRIAFTVRNVTVDPANIIASIRINRNWWCHRDITLGVLVWVFWGYRWVFWWCIAGSSCMSCSFSQPFLPHQVGRAVLLLQGYLIIYCWKTVGIVSKLVAVHLLQNFRPHQPIISYCSQIELRLGSKFFLAKLAHAQPLHKTSGD